MGNLWWIISMGRVKMSKTLDQYTPEQREQMEGIWCEVPFLFGWGTTLRIIAHVTGDRATTMTITGRKRSSRLAKVTPRWDLSRAWPPDGQPVPITGN